MPRLHSPFVLYDVKVNTEKMVGKGMGVRIYSLPCEKAAGFQVSKTLLKLKVISSVWVQKGTQKGHQVSTLGYYVMCVHWGYGRDLRACWHLVCSGTALCL